MRICALLPLIFILFMASQPVFSKSWRKDVIDGSFDPMVAAMLVPPFCQGNSGIGIIDKPKDWQKIYGNDFTYINHYCSGKHKIAKCYQYPLKEMKDCLAYFLEGTSYAIKNSKDPNYTLLPFLLSERGNLHKDIGNYSEAISDFKASISKNNQFVPAFLGIADTYIRIKNYEEAQKYIEMGLEHNPNKKSLQKKLEKIKKLRAK